MTDELAEIYKEKVVDILELTIVWMHGDSTRVKSFTWFYNMNINELQNTGKIPIGKLRNILQYVTNVPRDDGSYLARWTAGHVAKHWPSRPRSSLADLEVAMRTTSDKRCIAPTPLIRAEEGNTRPQLFRSVPSNTRKTCWLLHQVRTIQQRWRTVRNKQAAKVSTPDLLIKHSAYAGNRRSSNKRNYSPL